MAPSAAAGLGHWFALYGIVVTSDRATIFALSSGRPPAAIAVVRISGPRAGEALAALTGRIPPPRRASFASIRDPRDGALIDQGVVIYFPGPGSETGEPIAELQLHGSRAVVGAVIEALGRLPGCRPAQAGEFTRRAFENGKLDLTAVEGLADLIAAETAAQGRQATGQMAGVLSRRVEEWRGRLIGILALVEASIDFSDEGDVPSGLVERAIGDVAGLRAEIAAALDDRGRGERLRDGLVVAIAGPPNAGKSSLLNWLARRDAAIVSPYAGTTRDVIEVHLDLNGFPLTLIDTAGIRESRNPVEQEGIRRARERANAADLVLWVTDAREGARGDRERRPGASPIWSVQNKMDLVTSAGESPIDSDPERFAVSVLEGWGLSGLEEALARFAERALSGEPAIITRERHRSALSDVVSALDRLAQLSLSGQEDLLAEELRMATRALGRITGRVDVEDVLDVIFRDFCVGK